VRRYDGPWTSNPLQFDNEYSLATPAAPLSYNHTYNTL
jgi:hypothetical protein